MSVKPGLQTRAFFYQLVLNLELVLLLLRRSSWL